MNTRGLEFGELRLAQAQEYVTSYCRLKEVEQEIKEVKASIRSAKAGKFDDLRKRINKLQKEDHELICEHQKICNVSRGTLGNKEFRLLKNKTYEVYKKEKLSSQAEISTFVDSVASEMLFKEPAAVAA